jgi:hypothetical protein
VLIRCADLIQNRVQDLETACSTQSETQERISQAMNWIEDIEKKFKLLSKTSSFDSRDAEKLLEQCEVSTILCYQFYIYGISFGLLLDMICIKQVVCFLYLSLGEGIENNEY